MHKRIALVTLGGTVSSTRASEGLGVVPVLAASALEQSIGPIPGIAIEAHEFRLLPSPTLSIADGLQLHAFLSSLDVDGVVISQGTDSIEEMAFQLDVLGAASTHPVVVTGAMRGHDSPGADGPANLRAAALTAASPDAVGCGVLVVFADGIHAARFVTKASSTAVAAFESKPAGPVGWIEEGRARLPLAVRERPHLVAPEVAAPVAILTAGFGDDLAALPLLADAGYGGVVIAGLGGGHVSEGARAAIETTIASIPVVIASRIPGAATLSTSYGYPGGDVDLARLGCMSAGTLTAAKARVLLALLLGGAASRELIAAELARFAG
jgi:L-asparaginase